MSKFDAANAVEKLEYDFSAYGGDHGVSPEPSYEQIRDFQKRLQALGGQERLHRLEEETVAAADTGEDPESEYMEEMSDAIADLCSHQPSAKEINRLPFRVRIAYFGWITGEVVDPETLTAGTKLSRAKKMSVPASTSYADNLASQLTNGGVSLGGSSGSTSNS